MARAKKKKLWEVEITQTSTIKTQVIAYSKEEAYEIALNKVCDGESDISYTAQEKRFMGLDTLVERGLEGDVENWTLVQNNHQEGFPISYGYSLIRTDRWAFISGCQNLSKEEIDQLLEIRTKATKEEKEDLLNELKRRGFYVND